MLTALIVFVVGMLLSAFFSGSETGFYRATRIRLAMDAIGGKLMARSLIWMTNNPTMFVATTLIGNNLANNVTSYAIVLASSLLFPQHQALAAAAAPALFSPFVFVYGELMPKNLFFQAPNRLLRLGAPLFLVFSVLFLPVSTVLWLLGRLLQMALGEAPEKIQFSLARKELQRVFDEGHHVGLLLPPQQRLAQDLLSLANVPVKQFAIPLGRIASVPAGTMKADAYRLAKRHRSPALLVTETNGRRILGYALVVDLRLDPTKTVQPVRILPEIKEDESPISALVHMQDAQEILARLVDSKGHTTGLLHSRVLLDSLTNSSQQSVR